MKALITLIALAVSLASCSTTKQASINETTQTACSDTGLILLQKEILGQSGCCSWHGGACGCSGGRVVCCDNTYSPSCGCKTNGTIE